MVAKKEGGVLTSGLMLWKRGVLLMFVLPYNEGYYPVRIIGAFENDFRCR